MTMTSNLANQKGLIQTDYIIAIGIFILLFAFAAYFVNNYLLGLRESDRSWELSADAQSLLSMADFRESPAGWPEIISGPQMTMHFDGPDLGYNATASGSSYNASGRFGGGWSFSQGFVQVPAQINTSGGVTLEAWIYPNQNISTYSIMGKGPEHLEIQFSTATVRCIPTDGVYLDAAYHMQAGNWTHLACAYKPSATAKVYVNGQDMHAVSAGPNPTTTQLVGDSSPLLLGRRAAAGQEFNGTLDEVAIYNSTLDDGTIMSHAIPELRLERIGLAAKSKKYGIMVSNNKQYWRDQSVNVTDLVGEVVSADLNLSGNESVQVNDPDGVAQQIGISGTNVTFLANVAANRTLWYYAYVSEGPAPSTTNISGTDLITETVIAPEEITILDSSKIQTLMGSNYTAMREGLGISDFRIRLTDMTSLNSSSFGGDVPRRGDVVAIDRLVIYQNSTGGLRPGRLTVLVW